MENWSSLTWGLVLVGVPAGLYGLHRLALRLEDRGHLYYLRKKPRGGGAGCFVALQEFVEPQSKHVVVIREEKRRDLGGAAGPKDQPEADATEPGSPDAS